MGAALQRSATDTTCNDTRQADGEPRKLLSSVDVALAIADRTDPTNSGNPVGAMLYDVTTVELLNLFPMMTCLTREERPGSRPPSRERIRTLQQFTEG